MHDNALQLMSAALHRFDKWPSRKPSVLDVGSLDVNGTFRPLIEERNWQYTGLDLVGGPNVDVVSQDPYLYPFWPCSFDVVISGNMLHNVAEFWRLIPELTRLLKGGGLLAIVTHTWGKPPSGKYPADHWRFMPDGLRLLFELTGDFSEIEIVVSDNGQDIAGSAVKR